MIQGSHNVKSISLKHIIVWKDYKASPNSVISLFLIHNPYIITTMKRFMCHKLEDAQHQQRGYKVIQASL